MRIALSGAFYGLRATGSGQYLHALCEALAAECPEHEYRVYVPRTAPDDVAGDAVVRVTTPVNGVSGDLAKVWFEQVAIRQQCRRDAVDLLHIPYFAPLVRPGALPTVVTIHDVIPLILPAYRGSVRVRLYTRLVCGAASRARIVVTDSEASARDIARLLNLPRCRVRVVYPTVSGTYRAASREQVDELRARLSLPERYLLYLGGFDRRKNVPELLRALAQTRRQAADIQLVVAGRLPTIDTAFAPDPLAEIDRLGLAPSVHCPGWIREDDKPALYTGARAFVFPSRYEGFGLPVLEAIACGTPCVVASGSSLEEVAGEAALVVPPTDVEALAQAMLEVWRSDETCQRLALATAARAAKFTRRAFAAGMFRVYTEAMA